MEREGIIGQAEAAKRLQISQQEISDYTRWKHIPRPTKLADLAARIGATRESFLPDAQSSTNGASA